MSSRFILMFFPIPPFALRLGTFVAGLIISLVGSHYLELMRLNEGKYPWYHEFAGIVTFVVGAVMSSLAFIKFFDKQDMKVKVPKFYCLGCKWSGDDPQRHKAVEVWHRGEFKRCLHAPISNPLYNENKS